LRNKAGFLPADEINEKLYKSIVNAL
jgi:hypothetical protein